MSVINKVDFNAAVVNLKEAKDISWDVIIIGAGMGGLAAAYQFTQKGKKVLIVEKGEYNFSTTHAIQDEEHDPQRRIQNGHWPTQLSGYVDGVQTDFWPPLGCGVGGSTLLYAAALHRLEPVDFSLQELPDGRTIEWPFSYEELEPYYQEAEKLFHVAGTEDPLSNDKVDLLPPPEMSELSHYFFDEFQSAGLHPYRLHVGVKYCQGCTECGGKICLNECKQDAREVYAKKAVQTGLAFILPYSDVLKLEATEDCVTSVVVQSGNIKDTIFAETYILAAGAYITPTLLQRSKSESWPAGIGNHYDQVGRNLMFHSSDYLAFWPSRGSSRNLSSRGANKTISLRDYYSFNDEKLGEFQSTGLTASYGNVLYSLRQMFDQSRFKRLSLLRHLLRIPAWIASKLFGEATVFATVLEDFPYEENRVFFDESSLSSMRFEYQIHPELESRVLQQRKLIRQCLSHLKSFPLSLSAKLNFGHPAGTCKAGLDPKTSVVDKNCKVHGVKNLYVVDGSFMPTSGGTNPSLTIAANAMRVVDSIVGQ